MAISPHTPAGTTVVCSRQIWVPDSSLPTLDLGARYVVAAIQRGKTFCGSPDYGVRLVGFERDHDRVSIIAKTGKRVKWIYHLDEFSLPVLPQCLTDCLNVAPAPKQVVLA